MHAQPMDIATTIRVARRKKGISQRTLAGMLKVAPSAVAQWETNKTMPSLDNRVDISRLLDIPFSSLLPEATSVSPQLVDDPQALLLVRKFLGLPPRVREVVLMQVSSLEEALAKERADRQE